MNILKSKNEKVFVFDNYLTSKECDYYHTLISDLGVGNYSWEERTIDITNDKIVNKTINFFKNHLNLKLKIEQAQIQNWNTGSSSELHIHNENNRESTKYNSLIYLNDDFDGGEFFTKNGIVIKPKKGLLTIFNGQKVWHGVKTVKNKDRKTIIFWWK